MRGLAALLAIVTLSAVAQDKVLRVVPHSNLNILDPIWTTQYMARNHGYMVYDTLFGTDEKNKIQPQMVEKWTESPDHAYAYATGEGGAQIALTSLVPREAPVAATAGQ